MPGLFFCSCDEEACHKEGCTNEVDFENSLCQTCYNFAQGWGDE